MIGLLEILRRKRQFIPIVLVFALISYLVVMINGLGTGLNDLAGSALKNFDADAIAYSDSAGLSVLRSEMSPAAVDAASHAAGVREAAPIGYTAANYTRKDGAIKSVAVLGFEPGTIGEPDVTLGEPITEGDTLALIADRSLLRTAGLNIGDTLTISIRLKQYAFKIVGETDQGAFFFQPTAYILLTTWSNLRYGTIPGAERPGASIVLLKGSGLHNLSGPGYRVVDKETAFANIEGVAGQQATVVSLRMFGYVIGSLVIGAFFYVLTIQKVAYIGMLKAIGATNSYVLREILMQVLFVSLLGLLLALPAAYATERFLEQFPDSVPVTLTKGSFVSTPATLVITALLGSVLSGRQILKIDPIIALGQQQ